jgi:CBS domain-containing protein
MTTGLVTVDPDTTVDACMQLMTEHKIRHLPVLRQGHIAGIISIGDCVRELSERARGQVEDLRRFVAGEYPA